MQLFITFLLLMPFTIQQSNVVKLTSPKQFAEAMTKEKGILLDIRTPGEFRKGHLKGAVLLDFFRDDFEKELNKLDKKKTYFIYCGIGGRSEECGQLMSKQGFRKVYDLDGGISRWKSEGLPIEQ